MALVVAADDDAVVLRLLQVNLEMEGHDVVLAEDGVEAVALVGERRPDLVLLDVLMPTMDGWAACEAIKADPELADTPVLFLTARSQDRDVDRGVSLGAEAFVAKPFDPVDLLDLIDEILAG